MIEPLVEEMFGSVDPEIYPDIDTSEVYTRGCCWVFAGAMNYVHGIGIYTITGHVFNLYQDNPVDIMGYHDLDDFFDWWGKSDLRELIVSNYDSWWSAALRGSWRKKQTVPFESVLSDALFRAQKINLEDLK